MIVFCKRGKRAGYHLALLLLLSKRSEGAAWYCMSSKSSHPMDDLITSRCPSLSENAADTPMDQF